MSADDAANTAVTGAVAAIDARAPQPGGQSEDRKSVV